MLTQDPKHFESIMQQPLQQLRGALAAAFQQGKFEPEDLDRFFLQAEETVKANYPELVKPFEAEVKKIKQILATGNAGPQPDLSSPLLQLLWAAGLAAETTQRAGNPGHLQTTKGTIRKQIEKHPTVDTYRKLFAFELESSFPGASHIRLGWVDAPRFQVSHHFNPDQRFLGMDILHSLTMGLSTERISIANEKAHTAADIMHEIAHGIGTDFTERMQTVRKAMEGIKKPVVSQDDYVKLAKLQTEWNVRFLLFDAAENNYANKFSANRTNSVNAYDYAINCTQAVYESARTPKFNDPPAAADKLTNLQMAIDSSFFKNNHLFEDSEEAWRKRHIVPEWITCPNPKNPNKKISGLPALKELMTLCGKLEELQPTPRDKWLPPQAYKEKIQECTAARNAIIDDIFDRFAADLLPELQQQTEQEVKQQMEQTANQPSPSEDQQEQDSESQGGQSSDKNQGEKNESQKGGEGKNSEKSEESSDNKDSGKSEQKNAGKNQSQSKDGKQGQSGNSSGKEKQEGKKGGGKSAGESKGDEQESPSQGEGDSKDGAEKSNQPADSAKGQQTQDSSQKGKGQPMTVEDIGKMPDIEIPPDTPRVQVPSDEIDNAKTVDELLQEFMEGQEQPSRPIRASVKTVRVKPDAKLVEPDEPIRPADWNDYLQIVAANALTIKQVQKMRDEIQKRQITKQQSRSRTYDHRPDDGNADRFDAVRHADFVTKIVTGQSVGEADSKRFVEDAEQKKKNAPINVYIILDISGSMKGDPFETAINAATVAYEGFKSDKKNAESPINVHISTLGGNMRPQFIAKPGDKHKDIGERIAGARDAIGGSTNFLPALRLVLDKAAAQKIAKDQPMGQSYVFVVSDCVFTDPDSSYPALMKLSQLSEHVNVDFLQIPAESHYERQYQRQFDKTVEQINTMPNIKNKMNVTPVNNIAELAPSMLGMLKQRVLGKERLAKPYGEIQKELKQITGRM